MSDTDDSSTAHKSRGGSYVAYVLIALVTYFLSIGPAKWLILKGYLPHEVYVTAYFPIEYLMWNTFLYEPIWWYIGLWVVQFDNVMR